MSVTEKNNNIVIDWHESDHLISIETIENKFNKISRILDILILVILIIQSIQIHEPSCCSDGWKVLDIIYPISLMDIA